MEVKNILEYIPFGHDNAVKRPALCALTGLSDRQVRMMIENESNADHPIINLQDGKGYFRPTEKETSYARIYRNQINKRAIKLLRRVRDVDRYLDGNSELSRGQTSIFDLALDTMEKQIKE